ncbi:MAG: c-type cytochrome [Nitrospirae bacterium]|nr:c-type cytochrome [Nitrospirota bacterium]MCL5977247.1 c-type cytochrome [Nitrospirota bacterium]
MRNRFFLWILFLSGAVLFVFTLIAAYREIAPEWKRYQAQYKEQIIKLAKDDATKKKAKELVPAVQQIYLGTLNRIDRCMSCHMGVENPMMANAKLPLKQHSGDYLKNHPPDKFGCTVCHYGQGRATNKKEAHAATRDTHWDFPTIPLKYIQSSCTQCHDYEMLSAKGYDNIAKGAKLFMEKGCRGCHKLNGIGGALGKKLDVVGSQPIAYFPMRFVEGDRNTYNWHKQHFTDPRALVPESEMKINVKPEETDLLATYVLSLRAGEMPKDYRRIKGTQTVEKPDEGEALYRMFCIACHTTGKDSYFDEIFNRTIPAIMKPAFLKTADEKYIKKVVEDGRAGTQMTSWKATAGGLTGVEINNLIAYITKDRPSAKPERFDFAGFKTDLKRGEELYNIRCALCHGKKGQGGEGFLGLNLRNPVVQGADPEFLAITVRDGRSETSMPPFGKKGVGFTDRDIADVVSYVKTMSKKK